MFYELLRIYGREGPLTSNQHRQQEQYMQSTPGPPPKVSSPRLNPQHRAHPQLQHHHHAHKNRQTHHYNDHLQHSHQRNTNQLHGREINTVHSNVRRYHDPVDRTHNSMYSSRNQQHTGARNQQYIGAKNMYDRSTVSDSEGVRVARKKQNRQPPTTRSHNYSDNGYSSSGISDFEFDPDLGYYRTVVVPDPEVGPGRETRSQSLSESGDWSVEENDISGQESSEMEEPVATTPRRFKPALRTVNSRFRNAARTTPQPRGDTQPASFRSERSSQRSIRYPTEGVKSEGEDSN